MTKLVLQSRGMSFESMNNKLCMEKSDLGNFRFYSEVSTPAILYQLEITTHDRQGIVNTYVETTTYHSPSGMYKRELGLCFYCEPTKQALLSEINKRFGRDYTEIEIV